MIVLDTHAWIWWLSDPERLSRTAFSAIQNHLKSSPAAVSTISTWELCMLVHKRRLELTLPVEGWIARVEQLPDFRFIPPDNRILIRSVSYSQLSPEPADRIIVATAEILKASLVTADTRLKAVAPVPVVW